jgi:hypothetical protein
MEKPLGDWSVTELQAVVRMAARDTALAEINAAGDAAAVRLGALRLKGADVVGWSRADWADFCRNQDLSFKLAAVLTGARRKEQ